MRSRILLSFGGSRQRGAVLPLLALSLILLMGMAALSIDLGVYYVAAQQAQDIADAAALAGAGRLRLGMDVDAARQEVIAIANANRILLSPVTVTGDNVQIGSWDPATKTVIAWEPTSTSIAVEVVVRRTHGSPDGPIPTFFARVLGIDHMEVTRSSVAGVVVSQHARAALNLIIVQDGSTSFQDAWNLAVDADRDLLYLINGVSIDGDMVGIITFNASLPEWYLRQAGLWTYYRPYPDANMGIKHTTQNNGRPKKTNDEGGSDPNGQVRPMVGQLSKLDPQDHSEIVQTIKKAAKLVKQGGAWGDTDTAAGINYAVDQLLADGGEGAQKVIVLVSDGKPHDVSGEYETQLREQAAVDAADRAESEGVRIHTVTLEGTHGANFEFNEGLIRNGGYALRAADPNRLRDILISVGTMEVGHSYLLR